MLKEGEMPGLRELRTVSSGENGEPLVRAGAYGEHIEEKYEKFDMASYTGSSIYMRETPARKLAAAAQALAEKKLRLRIAYGYRHPDVQQAYFERRRATLEQEHPGLSGEALDEAAHAFVAAPDVAGHPTGGAVDLTLTHENGEPLDMGTGIADYRDPLKIRTFAEGLTETQRASRRLLLDAMLAEGFAPFYGEWWHFSYGDREWAYACSKPQSLYSPVNFAAPERV